MAKLFYIGDTPKIELDVTDRLHEVQVEGATVSVFDDNGQVAFDQVQIEGNKLAYPISPAIMGKAGNYVAVFEATFASQLRKKHAVRFSVVPRDPVELVVASPVAALNAESSPEAVSNAVSTTIRGLRRKGKAKAAQTAYETARSRTGRMINL